GARRAVAGAERVVADDEPAVRVDRTSGSDHLLPPARRGVLGRGPRVAARRETRRQEERVVLRGREAAPRLVRERHLRDLAAAPEPERPRDAERAIRRDLLLDGVQSTILRAGVYAAAC